MTPCHKTKFDKIFFLKPILQGYKTNPFKDRDLAKIFQQKKYCFGEFSYFRQPKLINTHQCTIH
jgi:hypothetical protein